MIIECSECGREVSDKAEMCIGCGCPMAVIKDSVVREREKETEDLEKSIAEARQKQEAEKSQSAKSQIDKQKQENVGIRSSNVLPLIIFGLLVVGVVIVFFINQRDVTKRITNSQKKETTIEKTIPIKTQMEQDAEHEQQQKDICLQCISEESDFFNTIFVDQKYSRSDIRYYTDKFTHAAKLIKEYEKTNDVDIKRNVKKLREKVATYQNVAFPVLRREWARGLSAEMWEENGSAYVSGDRNNYVNFTASQFSWNKKIKEFQIEALPTLRTLRFTQARYRWYEGQRELQYYTLDVIKDSEIVAY